MMRSTASSNSPHPQTAVINRTVRMKPGSDNRVSQAAAAAGSPPVANCLPSEKIIGRGVASEPRNKIPKTMVNSESLATAKPALPVIPDVPIPTTIATSERTLIGSNRAVNERLSGPDRDS